MAQEGKNGFKVPGASSTLGLYVAQRPPQESVSDKIIEVISYKS